MRKVEIGTVSVQLVLVSVLTVEILLSRSASATDLTTSVPVSADTYVGGDEIDQNHGGDAQLRVGGSNPDRTLVRIDEQAVAAAIGSGSLLSANIELFVESSSDWEEESRPVRAHRLETDWSESGATWNCPNDSNPANQTPNCAVFWNGGKGNFASDPTASLIPTDQLNGYVPFDVTDDVGGFLLGNATNFGWLIKKRDEEQSGEIDYTSREGNAAQQPRLIVQFTTNTPTPTPNPSCAAAPLNGCRRPLQENKALLLIKDSTANDKDKLLWKWLKGDETAVADLGDPTKLFNGTAYSLCAYDEQGGTPSLIWSAVIPAAGTCNGKPCWKATGSRGFKYNDKTLSKAGLQSISLRAGGSGKAKVLVKGKGSGLNLPSLPLKQDQRVIVQLKNSIGQCWEAQYSSPAKRNNSSIFKDKADSASSPRPTNTRTPTGLATNTPPATPTGGTTATPTVPGTNTPTVSGPTNTPTRSHTPTRSPTRTNTIEPGIGDHKCALGSTSKIELNIAALPVPLTFTISGAVDLSCGPQGANGKASCTCGVQTFNPINIPSIGFVCIGPATGCPAGEIDCDGGNALSVDVAADGNIGACTGNPQCQTACNTHCAGMGKTNFTFGTGCTGHCNGGTNDNAVCANDEECPGGACNGPDSLQASQANICQCQCIDSSTGSAGAPGTMQCNLGASLNVESGAPCGDGDIRIAVGTSCIPLTTGTASSLIVDSNFSSNPLPANGIPASNSGAPITCSTLETSSTTGLKARGVVNFFGSALGDLLTELFVDCQ